MNRRILVGLLSVGFVLAGLAIAQDPPGGDDPPIRLKKKNRPEVAEKPKEEPAKPAEPPVDPKEKDPKAKDPKEKPMDDAAPEQPEMDEGEVLNRVGKNMRTSEDRLANRELTDGTRQVQDDIVKDLDSLINQMQNGGGGGADQNQDEQNQQNQDNKQQSGDKKQQSGKFKPGMASRKRGLKGQQQQQQARAGQKRGGQKPGGQQANTGQGNKPQQGTKPGGQQQTPSPVGGAGGHATPGEATKLAEVYKDVRGHLPEAMRAEMNAYSREQFMAKYNELIKQYYSTVAEKSRKKE